MRARCASRHCAMPGTRPIRSPASSPQSAISRCTPADRRGHQTSDRVRLFARLFVGGFCGGGLGAGTDAELDAVAVAVAIGSDPLIFDAAAAVGGIMGIAPADLAAFGLPDSPHQNSRTGENRGSVRQVDPAQRL